MGIGAGKAERVDRRPGRTVGMIRPGHILLDNPHRQPMPGDIRIEGTDPAGRRDPTGVHGQHHLDQSCDARRGLQMTDGMFHRSQQQG